MKKFCIIFLLSIIITVTAVGLLGTQPSQPQNREFIRIHVRADSDDEAAQAVKYRVRDAIVTLLTPIVAEAETYEEAVALLVANEQVIAEKATGVLRENGFDYAATAALKRETFPTRTYGEVTLPSGDYLALVVELGRAQGQNWWCVVYPPLCFAGQSGVPITYRSKIAEIIESWKKQT